MADVFNYSKKAIEFNNPNVYVNSKNVLKMGVLPEEELKRMNEEVNYKHEKRKPSYISLSNFPVMSEDIVNTS
jgi:hypothetical protein